jgi:glutamine amidotransferase
VNFAELNKPEDRAAVIVTVPLTANEHWRAFASNHLVTFVDGSAAIHHDLSDAHEHLSAQLPQSMREEIAQTQAQATEALARYKRSTWVAA